MIIMNKNHIFVLNVETIGFRLWCRLGYRKSAPEAKYCKSTSPEPERNHGMSSLEYKTPIYEVLKRSKNFDPLKQVITRV